MSISGINDLTSVFTQLVIEHYLFPRNPLRDITLKSRESTGTPGEAGHQHVQWKVSGRQEPLPELSYQRDSDTMKTENQKSFIKSHGAALAFLWGAVALGSVAFMKLTEIGPVILVIHNDLGIGVHSGDLLTLIPAAIALVFTGVLFNRHESKDA